MVRALAVLQTIIFSSIVWLIIIDYTQLEF